MKRKNNVLSIILMEMVVLAFFACSGDDTVTMSGETDYEGWHTAKVKLNATCADFDTDGAVSRVGDNDWNDGDRIYLLLTDKDGGKVQAYVQYDASVGDWEDVQYECARSKLTCATPHKVEAYFFDGATNETSTNVTFTEQTGVYACTDGTYTYPDDGDLTINVSLTPITSRIKFAGSNNFSAAVGGIKTYIGFSRKTGTLTESTSDVNVTVGSNGYTPYVYGVFSNTTEPELRVFVGEDYFKAAFDFTTSILTVGRSGYMNLPTFNSHFGWRLIEKTKTFSVGGITFNMMLVDAGTFLMGSKSGSSDEMPIHTVTISKNYYIGETEVTQGLWKVVAVDSPTIPDPSWSSGSGLGDDYPAYYITYEDVQSFIIKLNSMTGLNFRMPTEAEWEYAAKGGKKNNEYIYSGSNNIEDVAWYGDNSGNTTHPVKTKAPNELGIYDMSGNVWEWCSDWYDSYDGSSQTDPTGPSDGSARVYRGGSCFIYIDASSCRCTARNRSNPSWYSNDLGFRLVLPAE